MPRLVMMYDIDAKLYLLTEEEMSYLKRSLTRRSENQKTLAGILALGVFSFGQVLVNFLMTTLHPVWLSANIVLVFVSMLWYFLRWRQAQRENEDFIFNLDKLRRTAALSHPKNYTD